MTISGQIFFMPYGYPYGCIGVLGQPPGRIRTVTKVYLPGYTPVAVRIQTCIYPDTNMQPYGYEYAAVRIQTRNYSVTSTHLPRYQIAAVRIQGNNR